MAMAPFTISPKSNEGLMKFDIKSTEDFIRLAKEAIDQENQGMTKVPSNQADPRNIPREGAEIASLAAMHFFSFLCKKANISDMDPIFNDICHVDTSLITAMEDGGRYYGGIYSLNRIIQLSQENSKLADLPGFQRALPAIKRQKQTSIQYFSRHIDGVIRFLQNQLTFVSDPRSISPNQLNPKNIPCENARELEECGCKIHKLYCKKAQITDSKFHITEPCFQQKFLFPAMDAGIKYYQCILCLNKIVELSQTNDTLTNLTEFKEALPTIEKLRETTIKAFRFHIDAVAVFLHKQMAMVSQL